MVRGQWASLARMPGLHPYSFSNDILGFLMTTESRDLGLTSHPKDGYRIHTCDHEASLTMSNERKNLLVVGTKEALFPD